MASNERNPELSRHTLFRHIMDRLPADLLPQFYRKIGIFENDYDNIRNSGSSVQEQNFKILDRWIMRCGLFNEDMDKILRDAVQEILSNERNAAVDDWLSVKSPELHTNRNVAWLFYSIVFYYHDDDIWYREIARKLLKLQSYEIEQLKNNYQNDIIEIKYKILRRWKQRQVGHLRSAEEIQQQLETIGVTVPPEGGRTVSVIPRVAESDVLTE